MLENRKAIWGYLFILPNFLGFLSFALIPVVASFLISFTNWDIISSVEVIGLDNYITLFRDSVFIQSLLNTLLYTILTVPTGIILSLLLAVLFNRQGKFVSLYRTFAFIPVVTSMVAVALVWALLFNTDYGLLNILLEFLGLPPVGWLTSSKIAMVSVAMMSVWKGLGYNMTIYLAGLQGIPRQIYEAATIDGASPVQSFFHITLPLLSPTTYFITIMSVIGSFQVFDQIYIMTNGGPANATKTIVMYLYQNAFQYLKMGYASSMAYVLFIIIFILSLVQFRYSQKWSEFSY